MKKKAGQGGFRLTRSDIALGHVLSGFLVDRRMWSSAEPSSVVQSIQALVGQDASELRYAATVTIWVRWTFQPACGAETSYRVEHGVLSPGPDRRHPAAAPQRAVSVRSGADVRRLPTDRLARRADGVAARAALRPASITGGAEAFSLNSTSILS